MVLEFSIQGNTIGKEGMALMGDTGTWIPLMEYALKKGISLSTLRRHIKSNKVEYRVENGKYFLWNDDSQKDLQQQLLEAKQEIAELKMLVALYEEKLPHLKRD